MSADLAPFAKTTDSLADTDRMDARLRSGASKNKNFLLKELKSGDADARSTACFYLGTTNDRSLGPTMLKVAQSDKDPMVRIGALMALGHVGGKESVPFLEREVDKPLTGRTWTAATSLYRIDLKGAVKLFKSRIPGADLDTPGKWTARVYMAACILDSDPSGEAGYVSGIVQQIRRLDTKPFTMVDQLEADAKARRHPVDVLKWAP